MPNTALGPLRVPESPSRQLVLAGVIVLVLTLLGASLWWWLRPEYQLVFSELRPADAATFAAELERRKIRYKLSDDERSLLVAGEDVRALRLKLMSQDLPVRGGVGFELFNNSSFGLTEFAQKVNYQRALQGELARTITSLAEVESARVHLSMPEASMFRRAANRPKASVALAMRGGAELEPATVRGIQRLVAAAVPELEVADVTVLDARGAAFGRGGMAGAVTDPKLELKIEVEQYYARKVLDVIGPLLAPHRASVSVDAQINHDQVRITQETSSAGRSVRRPAPAASEPGELLLAPAPPEAGSRRVEQVVAETGGLRRLAIGLQLQAPLDTAQQERLKGHIAAAVGLVPARGDVVSIFVREPEAVAAAPASEPAAPAPALQPLRQPQAAVREPGAGWHGLWLGVPVLAVLVGWWAWRRRCAPPALSAEEQRLLAQRLKTLLAQNQQVPHGVDVH